MAAIWACRMLITIIKNDTVSSFLSWLKTAIANQSASSVLYFYCAAIKRCPSEEAMLSALAPILGEKKATIFMFADGDVLLSWSGVQTSVIEQVRQVFYGALGFTSALRNDYFDLHAHAEQLRLLVHKKSETDQWEAKEVIAVDATARAPMAIKLMEVDALELDMFHRVAMQRRTRKKPDILIVEDQAFSRKLLQGMLEKEYKTLAAADASSALHLHLLHAPDIILLDIELPDVSGHVLAEAIRKFDPHAYIIMVTANHYLEDVTRARNNGAQGFIVKPYSKQKIVDAIRKISMTPKP